MATHKVSISKVKVRGRCLVVLLAVALCGCVSPYRKNYSPTTTEKFPPVIHAQFSIVNDLNTVTERFKTNGYKLVGTASFASSRSPQRNPALTQARRVGADFVLVAVVSQQTVSGIMPVMNYQPGQTYRTTFNGSVTSGGNFGYYDGVATTTTPAQLSTSYVPYQRTDYLYRAYFWRSPNAN